MSSWPELARAASIALSSEREDDSITARLIHDIHAVFTANDAEPLKTADLLTALYAIEESPWGEWHGKPLSPHGLSRLLHSYRITTMPVWVSGQTVRGYKPEQFTSAFAQFALPSVRSVRSVRSQAQSQNDLTLPNAPNASGNQSVREKPSNQAGSNAPNAPNASPREKEAQEGVSADTWTGPLLDDPAYLPWLYSRFEQGLVDEDEWHLGVEAHRAAVALLDGLGLA